MISSAAKEFMGLMGDDTVFAFYSGALCFIEWPELVEELLPLDAKKVTITENGDGSRTITI